jgi:hypothetical protein
MMTHGTTAHIPAHDCKKIECSRLNSGDAIGMVQTLLAMKYILTSTWSIHYPGLVHKNLIKYLRAAMPPFSIGACSKAKAVC